MSIADAVRGTEDEDAIPEAVFVHGPDGTFCADCIPDELRAKLGDPEVETWRYLSSGWIAPPVCDECKLAIPVYVDGVDDHLQGAPDEEVEEEARS